MDCPTCGESESARGKPFTERSVKIHHKRAHGESIAKEESECLHCGTVFEYYSAIKPGYYCSECVDDPDVGWGPDPPIMKGDQHYAWQERVEIKCCNCGEASVVRESVASKEGRWFCDRDCWGEWFSEYQSGSNNVNYIDGKSSGNPGPGWGKARRKALERDGHTCQNCGKCRGEVNWLDVHHIIPRREFEDVQDSHELSNLVVLCRSCHVKAERGSIEVGV